MRISVRRFWMQSATTSPSRRNPRVSARASFAHCRAPETSACSTLGPTADDARSMAQLASYNRAALQASRQVVWIFCTATMPMGRTMSPLNADATGCSIGEKQRRSGILPYLTREVCYLSIGIVMIMLTTLVAEKATESAIPIVSTAAKDEELYMKGSLAAEN